MHNQNSYKIILAESETYLVYSEYESVFLKNKLNSDKKIADILITSHYGDPNGALILYNEKHIVVSGCGLSIYNVEQKKELHILNEPNAITWTNGLYEDDFDSGLEFRFIAMNKNGQLRVFKMNVATNEILEL